MSAASVKIFQYLKIPISDVGEYLRDEVRHFSSIAAQVMLILGTGNAVLVSQMTYILLARKGGLPACPEWIVSPMNDYRKNEKLHPV